MSNTAEPVIIFPGGGVSTTRVRPHHKCVACKGVKQWKARAHAMRARLARKGAG